MSGHGRSAVVDNQRLLSSNRNVFSVSFRLSHNQHFVLWRWNDWIDLNRIESNRTRALASVVSECCIVFLFDIDWIDMTCCIFLVLFHFSSTTSNSHNPRSIINRFFFHFPIFFLFCFFPSLFFLLAFWTGPADSIQRNNKSFGSSTVQSKTEGTIKLFLFFFCFFFVSIIIWNNNKKVNGNSFIFFLWFLCFRCVFVVFSLPTRWVTTQWRRHVSRISRDPAKLVSRRSANSNSWINPSSRRRRGKIPPFLPYRPPARPHSRTPARAQRNLTKIKMIHFFSVLNWTFPKISNKTTTHQTQRKTMIKRKGYLDCVFLFVCLFVCWFVAFDVFRCFSMFLHGFSLMILSRGRIGGNVRRPPNITEHTLPPWCVTLPPSPFFLPISLFAFFVLIFNLNVLDFDSRLDN